MPLSATAGLEPGRGHLAADSTPRDPDSRMLGLGLGDIKCTGSDTCQPWLKGYLLGNGTEDGTGQGA